MKEMVAKKEERKKERKLDRASINPSADSPMANYLADGDSRRC
jgi:hypothetical protein